MANKHGKNTSLQKMDVHRLAGIHYMLVVAYALNIILLDSWKVIVPKVVLERWTIACVLTAVISIVWYLSRTVARSPKHYRALVYVLILLDIIFAAFSVYTQRGIASKAVVLFAIPIAVSAALKSKSALYATAAFSVGAYALTVIRYFYIYPGEGYKAEMYSELFLYSAVLFIIARLLGIVVHAKK